MRIKRFGVCIAALCAVAAVSAATETGDKEPFWLGGDISGMTADEARGRFVMNRDSVRVETTQLMKDYGMNATRLRVWVAADTPAS